jgi:hypothetical protein
MEEFIMYYIQRKDEYQLETVDQFESLKESKLMLKEYRIADSYGYYYISTRACKDWNN